MAYEWMLLYVDQCGLSFDFSWMFKMMLLKLRSVFWKKNSSTLSADWIDTLSLGKIELKKNMKVNRIWFGLKIEILLFKNCYIWSKEFVGKLSIRILCITEMKTFQKLSLQ